MKVEVFRGEHCESLHSIDVLALDGQGRVLFESGSVLQPIYSRSAIKPLQALPVVERLQAYGQDLSAEELALACASHSAERVHVEIVERWLQRLGLGAQDLRCGTHAPYNPEAMAELYRQGDSPCPLHNNCSGKHTAQLNLSLVMQEDPACYTDFDHPVQTLLRESLADLSSEKIERNLSATDGCGIPTYWLPLRAIALACARFAEEAGRSPASPQARILQACLDYPLLTSGSETPWFAMMQALAKQVFLKVGAEGVLAAYSPSRGASVLMKCRDGHSRALAPVMAKVLVDLGWADRQSLQPWLQPPILNRLGEKVGYFFPS